MSRTYIDLGEQGKSGSLTNTQVATNASIAYSKLNLAESIQASDIAVSASIPYSKLSLASSIVNGDISASAAIAYSKLDLTGHLVNADVSATAAIAYSKLNLSNSIMDSDVAASASIAYSKLNLSSSLMNSDVAASAAIAYSKLSLADSIMNSDVAATASIAYSKLNLSGSIMNADVASSASIAYSKLNLSSSIVDADIAATAAIGDSKLAVSYLKADGTRALTGDLSAGSHKITGLASPGSDDSAAANKGYVDSVAQGLDIKDSVHAVAVADVASLSGTTTIDGHAVAAGERVLLTAQTSGNGQIDNGIWVVQASAWTRPADFNTGAHVAGSFVFVEAGDIYKNTGWVCSNHEPADVVGTNNLTFVQFSAAGAYSAASGQGLSLSGTAFSVKASDIVGTGLAAGTNAWNIKLADTTVSAASYGGAAKAISFTVDAQGRLTSASDANILIAQSQVTDLTTDLGAKVAKSTLGAKGSLISASAASTPSEVSVGTDGQFLKADSNQTNGLTWANAMTGSGTSGRVPLFNGTYSLTSDADFLFNSANNQLSVGPVGPLAPLPLLQLSGDETSIGILGAVYGGATIAPTFAGIHAGGTVASPTATPNDATLVNLIGFGHDGTAVDFDVPGAELQFRAAENWDDTKHGSFMSVVLVRPGTLTPVEALVAKVTTTGESRLGIGVGSPGYALDVAGSVNATGFKINGVALAAADLSDASKLLRTDTSRSVESGTTVTFNTGSKLAFQAASLFSIGGTDVSATAAELNNVGVFENRETPTGVVDGSNAAFSLSHTPISDSEMVFLNGVLQESGSGNDYTISGGNITFASAPSTGSKVRVSYRRH